MTEATAVVLSARSLAQCGEHVAVPRYDRSRLTVGIVHIGVGGFHRAHQAMYIDTLMNDGLALDWAICGVGVLDSDREMQRVLHAQDGLYTLVVKHGDGTYQPRVIGSLVQYLFAPDDPEAVIERLADPATRIVTLTITEGGYAVDDVTERFDPSRPEVAADLAPGAQPRTVFGLVCAALARRRDRDQAPFTIASCDNLPGNGARAHEAFTAFARLLDPDLGDWVEDHVRFPNAMVDRITPATTDEDRAQLADRFGVRDGWPVVCEPFTQWVLQDAFVAGRPPLQRAGVQLVDDVEPYELMKLRLLNASHQGLCYFARLCDYELVHEAAQDPLFARFLRGYMDEEATPTLPPVAGVDLDAYKTTLIERFSNPEIRDTVARLCAESSDRIPKWLLPVVRVGLRDGRAIARAAAIVASWARYAEGVDEHGEPIEVVDERRDQLLALAARQREEPLAFIANRELFGDLSEDERFTGPYLWALQSLHEHGARATLTALVERSDQAEG